MQLFRKSKVLKILKEYHRIYNTEIPANSIGIAELEALKEISLQELAIAYDTLEGYKYFEAPLEGVALDVRFHMPEYSMYAPSFKPLPPSSGLNNLIRKAKNVKFLVNNNYIVNNITDSGLYIPPGSSCWKHTYED